VKNRNGPGRRVRHGASPGIVWLAAGDLDGDGRIDLVFPAGNTVVALVNTCP